LSGTARVSSLSAIQNHILLRLPASELDKLRPHLEAVQLNVRTTLIYPNEPIAHVIFMESGLGSEIALGHDGNQIEVGLVGREGLIGLPLALGQATSPHKTFMQVSGSGVRISASAFNLVVETSEILRRHMLRYAYDFMLQVAQTALANGRYKIQPRLARWILMSHDRMDSEVVPLTHEFLALMLGIRRAGVTEAIGALERKGMVKGGKASILVLDRKRLEEVASGIYG